MFDVLGKARRENEPVWGDSAYRSADIEKELVKRGFVSKIHEKGYRNKPLTDKQRSRYTVKSKTRARVEHIFGAMYWYGRKVIRCIGINRVREVMGFTNVAYSMKRYCLYA